MKLTSCPIREKNCHQEACAWFISEYCCSSSHKEYGICSMKYNALKTMKGFKKDFSR